MAGAKEVAVINSEGGHVKKQDFENLRYAVHKSGMDDIRAKRRPIRADKWVYGYRIASLQVLDEESLKRLKEMAEQVKLQAIPRQELEATRKPTTVYSGLLTGPGATQSREEIELLLGSACSASSWTTKPKLASSRQTKLCGWDRAPGMSSSRTSGRGKR